MPPINKLTEVKIKNIKPSGKIERYADGGGLYLEVSVAGGKHWHMKYRVDGKEKRLSSGAWPDVSPLEARDKRDDAKRMLRESRDPGTEKKKAKTEREARPFRILPLSMWRSSVKSGQQATRALLRGG